MLVDRIMPSCRQRLNMCGKGDILLFVFAKVSNKKTRNKFIMVHKVKKLR